MCARTSVVLTAVHMHCKTTSLATWLVNPFGLVSILLGQQTRDLADA